MPEDNNVTATPVPKSDDAKPVVWTPEDASRFLTSAIHEAQRPLADALKQRPITSRAFALVIAVIVLGALCVALLLSSQLEKSDARADAALKASEDLMSEQTRLQVKSTTLEERLNDANRQLTDLRDRSEKLVTANDSLQRYRRQNELLKSQISGLEMEKVALARQLEAVRAMAIDEGLADEAAGSGPFVGEGADADALTGTRETEIDGSLKPLVISGDAPRPDTESLTTGEAPVEPASPPAIAPSPPASETISEPVGDLQPDATLRTRPEEEGVSEEEAVPEEEPTAASDTVAAPEPTETPSSEPVDGGADAWTPSPASPEETGTADTDADTDAADANPATGDSVAAPETDGEQPAETAGALDGQPPAEPVDEQPAEPVAETPAADTANAPDEEATPPEALGEIDYAPSPDDESGAFTVIDDDNEGDDGEPPALEGEYVTEDELEEKAE